jgi:DNA-binding transcriptional LysR family regulator
MAPGVDVSAVALIEPALTRDITLAWRADRRHSPAAAEFMELARATYSGEFGPAEIAVARA